MNEYYIYQHRFDAVKTVTSRTVSADSTETLTKHLQLP